MTLVLLYLLSCVISWAFLKIVHVLDYESPSPWDWFFISIPILNIVAGLLLLTLWLVEELTN